MEDEKDVLAGEYRKSPAFAGYHTFAPTGHMKDRWKAQFSDLIKLKKMIQLWPLQIYLETLSISIHLKMKTEELSLNFSSCFDTDEMSISSRFKFFS